jgi:hypothetical protein
MGGPCGTNGNRRVVYRVLVEQHDGQGHLEDLEVVWGIILTFVFKIWDREP